MGGFAKREDGKPWRLDTIFRMNMQSAFSEGRYQEQKAVADTFPYWEFVAIDDRSTTDGCRSLNGTILKQDDPFWSINYPPRHFHCRSRVRSISKYEAAEKGFKASDPTKYTNIRPAKGFDTNPGEWTPNLGRYDKSIGSEVKNLLSSPGSVGNKNGGNNSGNKGDNNGGGNSGNGGNENGGNGNLDQNINYGYSLKQILYKEGYVTKTGKRIENTSKEIYEKEVGQFYEYYYKGLSEAVKAAIKRYKGDDFVKINRDTREGKYNADYDVITKENMSFAIRSSQTLHRGEAFPINGSALTNRIKAISNGHLFNQLISVSFNHETGLEFGKYRKKTISTIKYQIKLKSEQKVGIGERHESEIIINKDTKYRLLDIRHYVLGKGNNIHKYFVDIEIL